MPVVDLDKLFVLLHVGADVADPWRVASVDSWNLDPHHLPLWYRVHNRSLLRGGGLPRHTVGGCPVRVGGVLAGHCAGGMGATV